MFLALAKRRMLSPRTVASHVTSQRYYSCENKYYSCHDKYRGFKLCSINHQIESIIWDATRGTPSERIYYERSINELLKKKVVQDTPCCHNVNIHLAVLGNLVTIAHNLLEADSNIVNKPDINGSLPIDLAQRDMSYLLKAYGSTERSLAPQVIRYVRIPEYGWLEITPLEKAILEKDIEKIKKIIETTHIDYIQKKKLQKLTEVLHWRSRDSIFYTINRLLSETHYLHGCC
jgi:hypothetical protein